MKPNPLIAVTTYNQVEMTRKCMKYLLDLGFDIIVIDDNSTDGTKEYLNQIKIEHYRKSERMGLTDSWNQAYKYWKKTKEYSHLILMNNDVLVPKGCIENLMSDHVLTVPMCNRKGAGYACRAQGFPLIEEYLQSTQDAYKDSQKIYNRNYFIEAKCWTGFMMCMSRGIIEHERDDGNLFDPKNINVGNDDDLAKRVQAHIALGSFVYHYKGVSFFGRIAGRNQL